MILMGAHGGASGEAAKFFTWVVGARVGVPYRDSFKSNLFSEIFCVCVFVHHKNTKLKSGPVIPFLRALSSCSLTREAPVNGWSSVPHSYSSHTASSSPSTCWSLCPEHLSLCLPGSLLTSFRPFLKVTFRVMFSLNIC